MDFYSTKDNLELETRTINILSDFIEDDCYVVAQDPSVIHAVSDHRSIPTHLVLDKGSFDLSCVYYYHGIVDDLFGKNNLESMENKYSLTKKKSFFYASEENLLFTIDT